MITKAIDWEQRRYEIAKDMYCRHLKIYADSAVKCADRLIEELKRQANE